LLFISTFLYSQESETLFTSEINELNKIGKEIINATNDETKYKANNKFKIVLKAVIKNNVSFNFAFDSLKTISILHANNLKIYNWTIPKTDGTFEYFAFLQVKIGAEQYRIIELTDKSETTKSPENKILTSKSWYGALYYKIIYNKKLGENYYTLLGWDGSSNLTTKKIIEVINVSSSGTVKFGAPIFKSKKKTKRRIIFEYSNNVVMSLEYRQNEKRIVFDHLVPASSKLKGLYEYYGPALKIFDAYNISKGTWVYEGDTDVKLDRNIKDNFWKKPEGTIKLD
jgi:hypothetical protein